MTDLLLHPTTDYQLLALKQEQPHAVLISGMSGAGKESVAMELTKHLLQSPTLTNHPYFMTINPEKGSIGIEAIRNARSFLSHKTPGAGTIRRVIVCIDAHSMTTEAQNSLLKTLEEPPADTAIILTSHDINSLMPTIRSRTQHVIVLPVDALQAQTYFEQRGFDAKAVQTAYSLSDGAAGLMHALLQNQVDHPLVEAINHAKTLLQASRHERLIQVDELAKNKDQTEILLHGCKRVVASGLRQASQSSDKELAKRFYRLSELILRAQDLQKSNGNAKLLLSDLFLAM